MSWDYAELAKEAKKVGSPEKLMDELVNSGKKEMIPWLVVAAGSGIVLTIVIQKVTNYYHNKKRIDEHKVDMVKSELINGINNYDEEKTKKMED